MGSLAQILRFCLLSLVLGPSAFAEGKLDLRCEFHEPPEKKWVEKIVESKKSCDDGGKFVGETQKKHQELMRKMNATSEKVAYTAVANSKDAATALDSAKKMLKSSADDYREIAKEADEAAKKLAEKRKPNEEFVKALAARQTELQKKYMYMKYAAERFKNDTDKMDRTKKAEIEQREKEHQKMVDEVKVIERVVQEKRHTLAQRDQSKVVATSRALEDELKKVRDNCVFKAQQMSAQASKLDATKMSSEELNKVSESLAKGDNLPIEVPKDKPEEKKGLFDKFKEKVSSVFGPAEEVPLSPEVKNREEMIKDAIHSEGKGLGDVPIQAGGEEGAKNKNDRGVFDFDENESSYHKQAKLGAENFSDVAVTNCDKVYDCTAATAEKKNEKVQAEYLADRDKVGGSTGAAKVLSEDVATTLDQKNEGIKKAIAANEAAKTIENPGTEFARIVEDPEKRAAVDQAVKERNEAVENVCKNGYLCKAMEDNGVVRTIESSSASSHLGDGDRLRNIAENNRVAPVSDPMGLGYVEPEKPDTRSKIEQNAEVLDEQQQRRFKVMDEHVADVQRAAEAQRKAEAAAPPSDTMVPKYGVPMGSAYSDQLRTDAKEVATKDLVAAGAVAQATTDPYKRAAIEGGLADRSQHSGFMELASVPGGPTGVIDSYNQMQDATNTANDLPKSKEASNLVVEKTSEFKTNVAMGAVGIAAAPIGGSVTMDVVKAVRADFRATEQAAKYAATDAMRTGEYSVNSARIAETSNFSVAAREAPEYTVGSEIREALPTHSVAAETRAAEEPVLVGKEISAPAEEARIQGSHVAEESPAPSHSVRRSEPVENAPVRVAEESPVAARRSDPLNAHAEMREPPPARIAEEAPGRRPASYDDESAMEAPRSAPVREAAPPAPVREVAEDTSSVGPSQLPRVPSFVTASPEGSAPVSRMPNAQHFSAPAPASVSNVGASAAHGGGAAAHSMQAETVITRETAQMAEARAAPEANQMFERAPANARTTSAFRPAEKSAPAQTARTELVPVRPVAEDSSQGFARSLSTPTANRIAEENAAGAKELAAINQAHPASSVEMPSRGGGQPNRTASYDSSSSSLRSRFDEVERGASEERVAANDNIAREKAPLTAEERPAPKVEAAAKEDAALARAADEADTGEKKSLFQRAKEKLFGAKEEDPPTKWKVAEEAPANSREGRKPLADVAAREPEHPSLNVDSLMNNIDKKHGVIQLEADASSKTRGSWSASEHAIRLRKSLRRAENAASGKGTVVHELAHEATDVKEQVTRQSVFTSDSKKVYGNKDMGTYSGRSRADELEARVKQLASLRKDRLRAEQALAEAKGPARSALQKEIKSIRAEEKRILARARTMMERERELTLGALRKLDDPEADFRIIKGYTVPKQDRFTFRFTDADGNRAIYEGLVPSPTGKSTLKNIVDRQNAIEAAIRKKFGENSYEAKQLSLLGKKVENPPSISVRKEVVKERTVQGYRVSTGVDDVQMTGYIAADKKVTRARARLNMQERLMQIDSREAHLEKHYGIDNKKYDFGSKYESSPSLSSRKLGTSSLPDEALADAEHLDSLTTASQRLESGESVRSVAAIKKNEIGIYESPGSQKIATTIESERDLTHLPEAQLRAEVKKAVEAETSRLQNVADDEIAALRLEDADEPGIGHNSGGARDRRLASVAEDHPSRDPYALHEQIEEKYGAKSGFTRDGLNDKGLYDPVAHEIKVNSELAAYGKEAEANATSIHELGHLGSSVKPTPERNIEYSSASGQVFEKKGHLYGFENHADEPRVIVGEAASGRLTRLRAEQALQETADAAVAKDLKSDIAKIKKFEGGKIAEAREMIANERELNVASIEAMKKPGAKVSEGEAVHLPAKDSFVYKMKDGEGNVYTHRDLLNQYKDLPKAEAASRQLADIKKSLSKVLGADSEVVKGLDSLKAEGLTIKRNMVPERTFYPVTFDTGLRDVKSTILMPSKGTTPEQLGKVLESRKRQLEALDAHFDKHYGADHANLQFSPVRSSVRRAEAEDKFLADLDRKEAEGLRADRAADRPWTDPVKSNETEFAKRYGKDLDNFEAPAARNTPEGAERQAKHLAERHGTFHEINAADNAHFTEQANLANAGQKSEIKMAASMQAAIGKQANDVMIKDKDVVNQVFNLQKSLIWDKIANDPLLKDRIVAKYSDFNTVRVGFDSTEKAVQQRVTEIFENYNQRYAEYMDKQAMAKGWDKKATGLAEKRENWHHLGIGSTPDEANLAARKSREIFDETGVSHPRVYGDPEIKGAIQDDLKEIEQTRAALETKFGETKGVMVGEKGEKVLSAAANETIRKADQTTAGVKKALERQFETKFTVEEVEALRSYVNKADSFSPDLYVAERTEIPMDYRRNGLISVDLKGQNARNLEETMKAMVSTREGRSLEDQIRAIRKGEQNATAVLDAKRARIDAAAEKHLPGSKVFKSGDDVIIHGERAYTDEEFKAFAKELAGNPDEFRLTRSRSFYGDNGTPIPKDGLKGESTLSSYVVDAEKVEKDLRKGLTNKFGGEITKDTQIVVDMVPRSDGTKSIGVFLGGTHTPEQMQKIQAWSQKTLRQQGNDLAYMKPLEERAKTAADLAQDAIWASKLEPERVARAESVVGRNLSETEQRAVMKSHFVGEGTKGADGTAAKIGNYTKQQIAEKARILDEAGFTKAERRKLMEEGVTGSREEIRAENGSALLPENRLKADKPANAGITIETDLATGNSRIGRAPAGAEVVKEAPAPTSLAEKHGLLGKTEEKIMSPDEALAEYKRLQELRNPRDMPARPGADYYERQANHIRAQKELLRDEKYEKAFGGPDAALEKEFKLDAELKQAETAIKNAKNRGALISSPPLDVPAGERVKMQRPGKPGEAKALERENFNGLYGREDIRPQVTEKAKANLKKNGFSTEGLEEAIAKGKPYEMKPLANKAEREAKSGPGAWMTNRADRHDIRYFIDDSKFAGDPQEVAAFAEGTKVYFRSSAIFDFESRSGVISHEIQHAVSSALCNKTGKSTYCGRLMTFHKPEGALADIGPEGYGKFFRGDEREATQAEGKMNSVFESAINPGDTQYRKTEFASLQQSYLKQLKNDLPGIPAEDFPTFNRGEKIEIFTTAGGKDVQIKVPVTRDLATGAETKAYLQEMVDTRLRTVSPKTNAE